MKFLTIFHEQWPEGKTKRDEEIFKWIGDEKFKNLSRPTEEIEHIIGIIEDFIIWARRVSVASLSFNDILSKYVSLPFEKKIQIASSVLVGEMVRESQKEQLKTKAGFTEGRFKTNPDKKYIKFEILEESAPVKPEEGAPVKNEEGAPVKNEEGANVKNEEGANVKNEEGAPVKK